MGSYTGTVPSFLSGELPDGAKFAEITDIMNALTTPWTDFSASFTITAPTTNPTKGTSVYSAGYRRIGKTIDFRFRITILAGFAAGSGDYRFSLPAAPSVASQNDDLGHALVLDSGVAYQLGLVKWSTGNTVGIILHNGTTFMGSAGPGTAWATNDEIRGRYVYEAA